jgi:hypothetical protein
MIRNSYARALLAAAAICAAAAPGCRAFCGPEAGEENCEEPPRRLAGRMEGRMEEWKAKAREHFHEEPVVAPHSRFHPVPTRPVFEAPSPEELAALFPVPAGGKAAAEKSDAAKDTVVNVGETPAAAKPPALLPAAPEVTAPAAPAPAITVAPKAAAPVDSPTSRSPSLSPPQEDGTPVREAPAEESPADEPADSPLDPPTRTANRPPTALTSVRAPSLNAASPEAELPPSLSSTSADEVRSTFRPAATEKPGELPPAAEKQNDGATDAVEVQAADSESTKPDAVTPPLADDPMSAILPERAHHSGPLDLFGDWDGPLLWRAVKTPSGSLRAVPASFVDED